MSERERGRDGGGELPDPGAGDELVGLLYGELEPEEAERASARVAADPALSARLGEMRRVRELFSALEEEEPPARLGAQLLAEAARAAPQRKASPEAGFWARLVSWLQPVVQRPALAAAASLVLVAGVAGVLYMRKGEELTSTAPPPAAETATGTAATAGDEPPAAPATAATPPAADDLEGARAGEAAADQAANQATGGAPAEASKEIANRPAAKRRKSTASAPGGKADLDDKAPAKPSRALESGGVYGLSEQELVPADEGQVGGGGAAGSQKKAEEAPAQAAPEPAPSAPPPPPAADSKAPAPTRVADLHRRAVDAALDNRCSEVRSLAGQVRAADAAYYARSFAPDKRLQSCLRSGKQAPAKK